MRRRTKRILAAASGLALVTAGGVGVATATGGDDSEQPITGPALDRASAAAIQPVGGGRVTGTEVGDEESYYEVEVTRADGSQVDVQLDRQFNVVGGKADSDSGRGDSD